MIRLAPYDFFKELEKVNNKVLIDVRMQEEFCKSRIENSVWAGNKEMLDSLLAKINPDIPIFVYCEQGIRTKEVITLLAKRKIKKVYELQGGYLKWIEQGFPVDSARIPGICFNRP